MAICEDTKELKWFMNFLSEIGHQSCVEIPLVLKTDSKSAIDCIKGTSHHCRTKHINIKYFFVKDEVSKGNLRISFVNSEVQETDLLTKRLPGDIIQKLLVHMGLLLGPNFDLLTKEHRDDSRSGRPLTSTTDRNIGQVRDLIVADRKIAIDNKSEILGILIITGDETWCFLFDPQTKKQTLEWHTPSSPRMKKVHLDKSKGKCFSIIKVYYEFIKEGNSINKQWKLLHDNAPAHRAIIVQDNLPKHPVSVLPHPPYSPDIAPCDFFFFPKLKMTLKGRRFSSPSEVIEIATVELNKLRKIDFELAFQQLFSR
ncbi:hypothetical protein LAZ67_9003209 [Cordylochernes scorpioides]|uniref:Uncharacterized protein n=1 Tax=Cordylochernes scorpioides TaxID=51811 RepID=A0ABY6KUS9_9ARAC|nr:hypothetical protein LAZ67_9003209 [Cordylochernes scorpioides]